MRACLLACILVSWSVRAETYKFESERTEAGARITSHGGAVAIGKRRLLTCRHLLGERNFIRIGERRVAVEKEGEDEDLDVAWLKVGEDVEPYAAGKLDEDEPVTLEAYPRAERSRKECRIDEKLGIKRILSKSAEADHGSSGGAVLQDGKLVGLLTSISADRGVFLPLWRLLPFVPKEKP